MNCKDCGGWSILRGVLLCNLQPFNPLNRGKTPALDTGFEFMSILRDYSFGCRQALAWIQFKHLIASSIAGPTVWCTVGGRVGNQLAVG
jgi:hypothetical protein